MDKSSVEHSSFRDPSGFLFKFKGTLYRQINRRYKIDYDFLINSGLYGELVAQGLIIPHQEVEIIPFPQPELAYKIIKPEKVDFISYPYEWSLPQMRGAALTTLRIARIALSFGMVLKDAGAYNIQFHKGRWRLIDTLSFERYHEGEVWVAYRQFCQHFLAPLALMAYLDGRLGLISRFFIDGIPLDIASKLLPLKTKLRYGLLIHIHLHARSQRRYSNKAPDIKRNKRKFDLQAMLGLLESLRQIIKSLYGKLNTTDWVNYYSNINYSDESFEQKKAIVDTFIDQAQPNSVWDLGSNTGEFSQLASSKGIYTVGFDSDPSAVAKNYIQIRKKGDIHQLPLLMDLTNPSPALGWGHNERKSLMERGPVDLVLALALIHHLVISNNVPIQKLASFLKNICTYLIIEFIPKSDSMAKRLLQTRKDIFFDYNIEGFESAFGSYFKILRKQAVLGSERIIYLMRSSEID